MLGLAVVPSLNLAGERAEEEVDRLEALAEVEDAVLGSHHGPAHGHDLTPDGAGEALLSHSARVLAEIGVLLVELVLLHGG